jgi:hypothetical protein
MSTLILAPKFNSHGKHDATGAFQPEARRFMQLRGGRLAHIDNSVDMAKRYEAVMREVLATPTPWETIAFFCHGTPSAVQLGIDMRTMYDFSRAVGQTSKPDVRILLYCCSTASTIRRLIGTSTGGDNGFADMLRDQLCRAGLRQCRVMGHETVGHTTRNPHVRLFEGQGSSVGGQGGEYIVRPGSTLWKPWRLALDTEFRFHFGYLSVAEIHRVLLDDADVSA